MGPDVKRTYRSSLRDEQARETRRLILDAARDLFVERGYVTTTVRDIAEQAGVSERTIYQAHESKRQVLFAVIDAAIGGDPAETPVAQRDWFRDVLDEPDPREQIAAFARGVRGIHERTADLVAVLRSAAAADPDIAEMWHHHARGQEEDERLLVESLDAKAALRPRLTPSAALDTVWALTTPLFYAQCREHGWTPAGYEAWVNDALARLLLD